MYNTPFYHFLPSIHLPHDSGPIQWARGVYGVKALPLAARPCVSTSPDSGIVGTDKSNDLDHFAK